MLDRATAVTGRVILVGGGPGADDLITVRGLDRLMAADLVITDRLAPVGLLARLAPEAEIIDAARMPGRLTRTHDQITSVVIDRALAGRTVVRRRRSTLDRAAARVRTKAPTTRSSGPRAAG